MDREVARKLALGVLNVAQGHPKLLELADGQARDPSRLSALVEAGDQAWAEAGGLPEGFFLTGESSAATEDYLRVLGAWTEAVCAGLTDAERTLFWFLCCLEEGERVRAVLDGNWADLWERLGLDGAPPGLDGLLAGVAACGLTAGSGSYGVHPGVAASGRAQAGERFRDAVDAEVGALWVAVARDALAREGEAGTTAMVVHAGLAAAPHLMRQGELDLASTLLERAFQRDRSRATSRPSAGTAMRPSAWDRTPCATCTSPAT